jgi:UDP-N-acetylmuramate: L-alanyl-gamma-D-glutamyl-meso-diaminopimelate ligase
MRHLHILGICGTFMGGIAAIAREAGWRVTGSDRNIYPPMSSQLERLGIGLVEGWDAAQLDPAPDVVVVGNVMTRGMPVVEALLDSGIRYQSGPGWLADEVLPGRHVIAVSGTHGKTTTSSLLAWMLLGAGHEAGFLIGGIPGNFPFSARLGRSPYFVIEADEYDTAFFDKRPKFLLYRPRTLVINNIEFDHADIYPDLDAIIRQFHLLVRTVPGGGRIVAPAADANVARLLDMGCWTPVDRFTSAPVADMPGAWIADSQLPGRLAISRDGRLLEEGAWPLAGSHNAENALAALLAAQAAAGVEPARALAALAGFLGVKRRQERLAECGGIEVYDDFAHHPTAIRRTLEGLRGGSGRLLAIIEPRSNSMKLGAHAAGLPDALAAADEAWLLRPPGLSWDLAAVLAGHSSVHVHDDTDDIIAGVLAVARPGDRIVLMSNGAFGNLRMELPRALRARPG